MELLKRGQHPRRKQGRGRSYEWEILRIPRAGLDEKLIPPAVESLETLGVIHVVHQDTAIGSTVERNPQ